MSASPAQEPYTIGQLDGNDRWVVLRGDEIVSPEFWDRETAINERDKRNGREWGYWDWK